MISDVMHTAEEKMRTSIDVLKKELATIRTGRASTTLVEHLRVDYGGVPTPLNQLARITAPEARLLLIQPWDRSTVPIIEKAILKSDIGINPSNDGNVIRLAIPQLTEERRQELTKMVKKRVEEDKIAIRNVRRDALEGIKKLEKEGLSQDESKRAQNQLQKLTDAMIVEAELVAKNKETEIAAI
jgi:ribosome recycling factor